MGHCMTKSVRDPLTCDVGPRDKVSLKTRVKTKLGSKISVGIDATPREPGLNERES
jgi:hypothetical protein